MTWISQTENIKRSFDQEQPDVLKDLVPTFRSGSTCCLQLVEKDKMVVLQVGISQIHGVCPCVCLCVLAVVSQSLGSVVLVLCRRSDHSR